MVLNGFMGDGSHTIKAGTIIICCLYGQLDDFQNTYTLMAEEREE
jgi:hypothetical protein